jgi:hypothetical protein
MANKCMKRYSKSLVVTEMQIKIKMEWHFTSSSMTENKCQKACEATELHINC